MKRDHALSDYFCSAKVYLGAGAVRTTTEALRYWGKYVLWPGYGTKYSFGILTLACKSRNIYRQGPVAP